MRKITRLLRDLLHELAGTYRIAADPRSFTRYAVDIFLFRLLSVTRLPGQNRARRIFLRGGTSLTYRLNRGDIQSVREIWIDQCYRPPFPLQPEIIVDLGTNIGMTSLWLAQEFRPRQILGVEPDPTNAHLARINLDRNGVPSRIIEAAVGPRDGTAYFENSAESNLGRVGSSGREVQMLSMPTVLSSLPDGAVVDLVKLDIEGGEQELLTGDLGWLDRVRALIVEFHPNVVDYPGLIKILEAQGFRYYPAQFAGPHSMDAFLRP